MRQTFKEVNKESYILAKAGRPLFGEVEVSGAKNMVTKIMTASLLAKKGKLLIRNVPMIGEVFLTLQLFDQLGVKYQLNSDKTLEIEPCGFKSSEVKFKGEEGNRISLLLAAPVIAQFGEAVIAKPKGCQIGARKIDFHIEGLKQFGAEIKETEDALYLKLKTGRLHGVHIRLPFPSVGATENLIITASCAEGESIIDNCAIEPEIIKLVEFLQKGGVEILIRGDRSIYIRGTDDLKLSDITIIPDRIEIVSLACATLGTRGDVFVRGARQDLVLTFLGVLQRIGAGIEIRENGIRFYYQDKMKPMAVTTEVYPGLPTDFQQPLAILLSQIKGTSSLHETIFENRFEYLNRLNGLIKSGEKFILGQDCPADNPCRFSGKGFTHFAEISGPVTFGKGEVSICDLRAGFALLTAGLLSEGLKITNLPLLFRGYENPVGKMKALGADVELVL